jgi:S-adenosyl methyltransferase
MTDPLDGGGGAAAPNPPGIYDYLLGGKDNTTVDRAAAEALIAALPNTRRAALANRTFLVRVVEYLAAGGLEQFIDLGTGYPTSPNVHEIARRHRPGAAVVYVDNSLVITAHNRALLARDARVAAVHNDLTQPPVVLAEAARTGLIDFDKPVAVLLISVLHFVDPAHTATIVGGYVDALRPGSAVAISAATAGGRPNPEADRIEALYRNSATPFHFHSPGQFRTLFTGLDLVPPGIVEVTQWRASDQPISAAGLGFPGGVGVKP